MVINLQVHVYELTHQEDNFDLHYRLKDKIYLPPAPKTPASVKPMESTEYVGEGIEESKGAGSAGRGGRAGGGGSASAITSGCGNRESGFLLVTWNNVVLCEGNVLQLYDFAGVKVLRNYWRSNVQRMGFGGKGCYCACSRRRLSPFVPDDVVSVE